MKKKLRTLITGKKFKELTKEEQEEFLGNMEIKKPLWKVLVNPILLFLVIMVYLAILCQILLIFGYITNTVDKIEGLFLIFFKFIVNISEIVMCFCLILYISWRIYFYLKYKK